MINLIETIAIYTGLFMLGIIYTPFLVVRSWIKVIPEKRKQLLTESPTGRLKHIKEVYNREIL